MPSYETLFPSTFLKASDLQGRGAVTVRIERLSIEEIERDDGPNERKPVLRFKGARKGLVLNKTNAGRIAEIMGEDYTGWAGNEIQLHVEMTEFRGKRVPSIRVVMPDMGSANPTPLADEMVPPADEPGDDIPF